MIKHKFFDLLQTSKKYFQHICWKNLHINASLQLEPVLFMSQLYRTFLERQNYGYSKKIIGCQGYAWGWEMEMKTQSIQDDNGNKSTLYDLIMMAICHYTFVQIYGMHHIESELNVNYALWVIMICWYNCILSKTYPIWGIVIGTGGCPVDAKNLYILLSNLL